MCHSDLLSVSFWINTFLVGQILNIILTVMNYNSSEAGEHDPNKGGVQQSRTRLTLLADISETNPNLLLSQQESPVLTYIRQLQDNKQAEK